jgi:hypothetical protein
MLIGYTRVFEIHIQSLGHNISSSGLWIESISTRSVWRFTAVSSCTGIARRLTNRRHLRKERNQTQHLSVDTSRLRSTYRTGLQMAAKATCCRLLSLFGYLLWADCDLVTAFSLHRYSVKYAGVFNPVKPGGSSLHVHTLYWFCIDFSANLNYFCIQYRDGVFTARHELNV